MKTISAAIVVVLVTASSGWAAEQLTSEETLAKHREGSGKVADRQDELSADVDQLTVEQTIPQVIKLLSEVGEIMDEATDQLSEFDTGGKTLAAQTEVIEKIHAAAKAKQQQGGQGQSAGAMMDMMERMMGKKPDGDKNGRGKGGEANGKDGGGGTGGASNSANAGGSSGSQDNLEERRIPKAAGTAGRELPDEFRKALDAYNRGAEAKVK